MKKSKYCPIKREELKNNTENNNDDRCNTFHRGHDEKLEKSLGGADDRDDVGSRGGVCSSTASPVSAIF